MAIKILSMSCISKLLFTFSLMIVCSSIWAQGYITVGPGPGYDFDNIQSAVTEALSGEDHFSEATIALADSTYALVVPVQINFRPSVLVSLTIESLNGPDNCLITESPQSVGTGDGRLFEISGYFTHRIAVKNLSMSYFGMVDNMIFIDSPLEEVLISGNKIDYINAFFLMSFPYNYYGSVSVVMTDNELIQHYGESNNDPGISVCNEHTAADYDVNVTISNNLISGSRISNRITIPHGSIQISDNEFIGDSLSYYHAGHSDYNRLWIDKSNSSSLPVFCTIERNNLTNLYMDMDGVNADLKDNVFWVVAGESNNAAILINNYDSIPTNPEITVSLTNVLFTGCTYVCVTLATEDGNYCHGIVLDVTNCTFIESEHAVKIETRGGNPVHHLRTFMNNLVSCSSNPMFEYHEDEGAPLESTLIQYTVFENGYPDDESIFVVDSQTCVITDPLIIIDEEQCSYSLIWDESQKSPCINSGYAGENGELTDPDGTPPDIGSVYYPHEHHEYAFHLSLPPHIYWMSFPVVDDRTCVDDQYWNELGYMFTDYTVIPTPQLHSIKWSYYNNADLMYIGGSVWQNTTHRVFPPMGYKLVFNTSPVDTLVVNGFKADPETTPVAWFDQDEFQNWVGYFVPRTQDAFLALSKEAPGFGGKTYLDYVYSIQTRTWETKRIEQRMGASWIIGPERYTFSEGDMAVLVLFPDAPSEMFWKTDAAKTEPYIRETPHYFSYTEKLDYTPVYIEFDPEDLPDEVGVYINGQCKGAAVVDFDLLEVNLYDDAAKSDDFEILCYYEGKGTKSMKGWTIFNPESLVFEKVPLNGVNTERYIYISFTREAGSPALPLTTSLEPNYPNPFNPETRISFTLADPMPVKLEIYNLKGQRVKTLLAGELSRGRHSLHWNAKDEQNRKVASGIYFYKLSTSTGHYTAKMMLMK